MRATIIVFLIMISSLRITAVKEGGQKCIVVESEPSVKTAHPIRYSTRYVKASFLHNESDYICKLFRKGPLQELDGPLLITTNMSSTNNQFDLECMTKGYHPNPLLFWTKNGKIVPEKEVRRTTTQLPDQTYVTSLFINVTSTDKRNVPCRKHSKSKPDAYLVDPYKVTISMEK